MLRGYKFECAFIINVGTHFYSTLPFAYFQSNSCLRHLAVAVQQRQSLLLAGSNVHRFSTTHSRFSLPRCHHKNLATTRIFQRYLQRIPLELQASDATPTSKRYSSCTNCLTYAKTPRAYELVGSIRLVSHLQY